MTHRILEYSNIHDVNEEIWEQLIKTQIQLTKIAEYITKISKQDLLKTYRHHRHYHQ